MGKNKRNNSDGKMTVDTPFGKVRLASKDAKRLKKVVMDI